MTKHKPDIILGDVEGPELSMTKAKVKLSMWIDGDILMAIRKESSEVTGSKRGYQTYLNQRLREMFLGEKYKGTSVVTVNRMEALENRIAALEASGATEDELTFSSDDLLTTTKGNDMEEVSG